MIFWILIIFTSSVYSLTEAEVVKSVLDHYPLVQEAELKARSASAEVTSAEGAFDHKLSFKSRNRLEDQYPNQYFETALERQTPFGGTSLIAGHRQGRGHFPSYDGKYQTSGAGELFAGISVPVLRNFQTDENRTNLRVRQIEKKQAIEQLRLKKLLALHKALSLYYKWVLESQKLKINRGVFDLAKLRHSMLQKKLNAGDIEAIKLTDNQRAIDKRSGEVLKNEIELNKVRAELSLYVRDPSGTPQHLGEEASAEVILRNPETASPTKATTPPVPQLVILALEKEKLSAEQALASQGRLPGLSLELLGSRELSANAAYDPESLQLGLKFDLPLENRKANGKTVATLYKLKALERQTIYLEQELEQQVAFFSGASASSRERWDVTSREFENTQKLADAEKTKWAQGASDLFIVNLREQDVADVEIRRWSSLYDYHQYILDSKLFSGTLLGDSDQKKRSIP